MIAVCEGRIQEARVAMVRETVDRLLMLRDVPVAALRIDPASLAVVGRAEVLAPELLPIASTDRTMAFSRPLLQGWMARRTLSIDREGTRSMLAELGFSSVGELGMAGYGFSLSDQYWFLPPGDSMTWDAGNPYENEFSQAIGRVLVPQTKADSTRAIMLANHDIVYATSSPDAMCNGSLPKYWGIEDGTRRLFKGGKLGSLLLEPFVEKVATELCHRILVPGDYVEARLEDTPFPKCLSSTPCMATTSMQLVPAYDLLGHMPSDNQSSRFERYVGTLSAMGVPDARESVEKMLVVDHLIGNFDRHWTNFGVMQDSVGGRVVGTTPLFDMGEALWCDRVTTPHLAPHRYVGAMPFTTRMERQLGRYCGPLDWLDLSALSDFDDLIVDVLSLNDYARVSPAYLDIVRAGFDRNLSEVRAHQDAWARRPMRRR